MSFEVDALLRPLVYKEYWLAVWSCALLLGAAMMPRHGVMRGLGAAFMSVPLWTVLFSFLNSIPDLADSGSVLRPISPERLSRIWSNSVLLDVGYVGLGYLMWHTRGDLKQALAASPDRIAAWMKRDGVLFGADARLGRERGVLAGWLWFPVLLAGTIAFTLFIQNATPRLLNGDESRVWMHMTPYHAILISAAAAFTEEIVYRALLLTVLWRWLTRRAWQAGAAFWTAAGVQALVFGFAHAGYGTWAHILTPAMFGLIAALAYRLYGLWAAVTLHFLIDIYAIGNHAIAAFPWWGTALWLLLVANMTATVWYALRWGGHHRQRRHAARSA